MTGLIIFLGVVVGIILFFGIICLVIYSKIKNVAKQHGFGDIKIGNLMSEMHEIKERESNKPKSISGMTKLLVPIIVRDFPEFNENLLFNMTEDSLRIIFDSLNDKDKSKLEDIPLVKDSISSMIDDYEENNIEVNYSDIQFHEFSLKDYNKIDGVATVTVTTSVEYYFEKSIDGEKKIDSRYKKQARYTCKFIYIYDESLVKDNVKVLSSNCPNCGAVIKSLGHKHCEYCGTAIKEVNLKAWTFSSYQEY